MLNMTGVRRAVLATFLCAAPLFAASAQASTGMLEREAVREAHRHGARAAGGGGVLPLPLPEPPRASAASAAGELARVARSTGPERLLIGARTHEDLDGLAARVRSLGAEPELFETIAALAATVPSGADARGRAARRPARGVHRARPHPHDRRRPLRHHRSHERAAAADQVHLGLRHRARGRGARHRRRRLGPHRVRDRHRPRREPPGVRRPGRSACSTPPPAART